MEPPSKASETTYFGRVVYVIPFVFLIAFGLVPWIVIVIQSFSAMDNLGRFHFQLLTSVDAYKEILAPYRLSVLGQILRRGLTVASIDLFLAIPVAFVIVRSLTNWMRNLLVIGLTLPFFSSDVTRAFAWRETLGGHGVINRTLTVLHLVSPDWIVFSEFGITLALVSSTVPFAVFPIAIRLRTVRQSIWLAVDDLGIGRFREFLSIALPLARPGMIFGWIACFVITIGASAEIVMLEGPSQMSLSKLISDLESARKVPEVFALCTLSGIFLFSLAILGAVTLNRMIVRRQTGPGKISP